MSGNSVRDIRKINPFINGRDSLFVKAVSNGNVELANLILDKALKLNPIQPLLCTNFYKERYWNLDLASDLDFEAERVLDRARLRGRLRGIMFHQKNCQHLVIPPVISTFIVMAIFVLYNRNSWF
jgi:hypothetical protein